jgi:hypothetical protein
MVPIFDGCISRLCRHDRDNGNDDYRGHGRDGHNPDQSHPFGRIRGDDRDIGHTFLHHPSEGRSLPARASWKWPGSSLLRDSFACPKGQGDETVGCPKVSFGQRLTQGMTTQ